LQVIDKGSDGSWNNAQGYFNTGRQVSPAIALNNLFIKTKADFFNITNPLFSSFIQHLVV